MAFLFNGTLSENGISSVRHLNADEVTRNFALVYSLRDTFRIRKNKQLAVLLKPTLLFDSSFLDDREDILCFLANIPSFVALQHHHMPKSKIPYLFQAEVQLRTVSRKISLVMTDILLGISHTFPVLFEMRWLNRSHCFMKLV